MHFPNDGVVDGKAFCFVWFKEDNDGAKAIEGLKDKYSVADGKVRQHSRARGIQCASAKMLSRSLLPLSPPPPPSHTRRGQVATNATRTRLSSVRARAPASGLGRSADGIQETAQGQIRNQAR